MLAETVRRRIAAMPPCHTSRRGKPARDCESPLIRLRLDAGAGAVRSALGRITQRLDAAGISPDDRGTAELVLAEALNNIVEHAYEDPPGRIALDIDHCTAGLRVTLSDKGVPLPQGKLPAGALPALGTNTKSLPEGGFGWFLIFTLAQDITYDRTASGNRLRFILPGSGRAVD